MSDPLIEYLNKTEYYYSKGISTGIAVAIEIAEECESIAEFIAKARRRIQVGRE